MRSILPIALATSLAANPIDVPYQNDFNDQDISDFFCPSGNNYNWGWDWSSGKMLHWVSANNRVTTATSEILQLGNPSATAEDFYMKVTVEPQTFSGGGSIGFGACGSTQTLSTFYLADVKPAINRIRILKVGGGNVNLVAERTISGLSLTDLQPFDLELTGTYSGNSIELELTVTKGGASDTATGTHSPALSGHHFGLRSYNTGGSFEVQYDHYEIRPLHTVPIIFLPRIIAPVGETYSHTPTTNPDISLTTSALPSWLNFDGNTLSGIPTQPGTHEITLNASTSEATESHTYTLIVPSPTDLVISEFMADNDDTLEDFESDSSDWIELFNPTTSTIDLTNWSLTDDPAFPAKWTFPPGSVAPSLTKIIIFASGKDLSNHTNFSLGSSAGNHLSLHRPDGSVASAYPMYPEQFEDISYGLSGDYSSSGYLLNPTPASTNPGPSFSGFTADTTFSVDRGFFEAPFSTVINCDTPGATIAYTTDGTDPSPTNGTQISPGTSVPISSTTILRAAAFSPGLAPSNIDTQSYLFLSDIRSQSAAAPPGWPSSSVNGQVFNYGMDPDITNSISVAEFEESMTDIDTISMVTDLDNFVDPLNGIWVNAENRGPNWERPFSVELIKPGSSEGFQVDAGVRIRGGWSRRGPNPKHAFHLYFKEKYGDGKLRYPLFGLEGADEFDRLDLRTSQGRSWHFSNSSDATFNRDGFARHLQLAMGQPSSRSRYYHLYLNGIYFGIFQSQERTDKFFGAHYLGGSQDEWDVMKTRTRPHRVEALDGKPDSWEDLFQAATAGFSSDSSYFAVQGLDSSGQPDPDGTDLVEIDNLIDYMLVIFYTGQTDGPVNPSANVPKNFFAMRRRDNSDGFRFFIHDNEDSLNSTTTNNTGSNSTGDRLIFFNPKWLHQKLSVNELYRRAFGDRVHKHLFNNGALTPTSAAETFRLTSDALTKAIIGESARWGDYKVASPYTQATWQNAINGKLNSWIPGRPNNLLNQLRNIDLYPDLDAPSFSQHGGLFTPGSSITLTAPTTIYYTLDGTDPTEPGALTIASGSSLVIPFSLTLKARSFNGTEWSALNEASFFTTAPADASNLAITEIHYNPSGPDEGSEFIELKNTSTEAIHLDGLQFIEGISFTFPANTVLQPGAYILLVNDQVAFETLHGNVLPVIGEYSGKLSNDGEQLILADSAFNPILDFTYNDAPPWSTLADGTGPSLTFISEDPSNPENWRPSSTPNGTPGTSDSSSPSGNLLTDAFPNGDNLTLFSIQNASLSFSFQQSLTSDHLRVVPQISSDLITWTDITESSLLSDSLTPQGDLKKTYHTDASTTEGYLRLRLEAR